MRPSRGLPAERIRLPPPTLKISFHFFHSIYHYFTPWKTFPFFYIIPDVRIVYLHLKNISLTHNNSIFFFFFSRKKTTVKSIKFLSSFFLYSPGDVERAPTRRRWNSIDNQTTVIVTTTLPEKNITKNASNQNMKWAQFISGAHLVKSAKRRPIVLNTINRWLNALTI